MNKNQKIVLIIGNIVLFVVIFITLPAYLNPTRYDGGFYQILAGMPSLLMTCIAGATLLVWCALKDKKDKNVKKSLDRNQR